MGKSIFDLTEKTGYESPWEEDWIEDLKEEAAKQELERVTNGIPQKYVNRDPLVYAPISTSGPCGNMVVLSNIVDPIEDQPGSALITINMTYKVVTSGEGAAINSGIVNTNQFSVLYSKGDGVIQLKGLPSKSEKAVTLTSKEFRQSKRLDKVTGKPIFWNYYNVTIKYDFKLTTKPDFTLWDGILWLNQCRETNGIIYLLPYVEYVEKWYNAKKTLTIRTIKKELTKEERKALTNDDIRRIIALRVYEYLREMKAQFICFTLRNLILTNKDKYRNKRIFIEDGGFYASNNEFVTSNQELKTLLDELGSTFHLEREDIITGASWEPLPNFELYYTKFVEILAEFAILFFSEFKKGGTGTPEIGAAGSNESFNSSDLNLVLLNPAYFGKKSVGKAFDFNGMTATEVIVHETGHNAAAKFKHNSGDYEYDQQGLQSNQHNEVYPSLENTIGIINDATNRKNMTVK